MNYPISFYNFVRARGFSGSINTMLMGYYRNQGATGSTLNELEYNWLATRGFTQIALADRWMAYLKAKGHTGSLPDMFSQMVNLTPLTALNPTSLYAANELGTWYEPSDLATQFQLRFGNTAVTTTAQPVGMILDKRKGLALGANTVTNGTFAVDTVGWGVFQATLSVTAGEMVITATAADASQATLPMTGVVGQWYKATAVVRRGTNLGSVNLTIFDGVAQSNYEANATTVNATVTAIFQAKAANCTLKINCFSTVIGHTSIVDNVTIQTLTGNHSIQATAASRPVYNVTGAITYDTFDGVDDALVGGIAAYTSSMDLTVAIRKNSVANAALAYTADATKLLGVAESGAITAADTGAGTPTYVVDGVALNGDGVGVTRGQLYAALTPNVWHVLEIRGADLSTWTDMSLGGLTAFQLNGDIAAMILTPAQSGPTRAQVRTYIGNKVGLVL